MPEGEYTPAIIEISFRFKHQKGANEMNFYQCKQLVDKIAKTLWDENIKPLLDKDKQPKQLIGISIDRARSHPGTLGAKVR